MKEEWRPILKSKGQYEASSLGRIRNVRTGRILHSYIYRDGNRIKLSGFMSGRSYTVGALVWSAFHPDDKGRVYRINKQRGDRLDNLTLVPKEEDDA